MDTLLRDLFTGAEDEARKSRSKTDRQKQSDTATWQGVLHGGPEIDNDHRMKAATELAKLHGLKKGENPYEKVALVLNTLGSHLRDKTPQAGDAAASSAPSGVGLHPLSSAPAAVSGGIVDAAKATMPSDPQREKVDADSARIQEKSNAVGGGLLKKIGHGLNVGLTKLDQGIDTVGKGLMKAHIIGDPKKQPGKLIDYYTGSDGKRHDIFSRPDNSTFERVSDQQELNKNTDTEGEQDAIYRAQERSTEAQIAQAQKEQGVDPNSEEGRQIASGVRKLTPKPHYITETVPSKDSPTGFFRVVKDQTGKEYSRDAVAAPQGAMDTTRTSESKYDPDTGTTRTTSQTHKSPSGQTRTLTPLSGGQSSASPKSPRSGSGGRVSAMAQDWAKNGVQPSAKDRPAVEKYMRDSGMTPGAKTTPTEIKLRDDIKKVEPKVKELSEFIEQNNLTQAGQGGMFSPGAWWERSKVQKAWSEYSAGLPPKDKQLGQLIKYAAAIKIMGAAPWMSIGRGKYLYSEIVQHLPEPTDTPAQLYEKIQFYKTVLDDAKGSLPSQLTPLSGGGSSTPQVIKWTRDAQGNPVPAQ